MADTTFEASGNIAIVAAIFPAFIAIDVKLFAALGTSEMVDSFSLDLTEVIVPPCVTAFIAAKSLPFLLGDLPNLLSAIFTASDFLRYFGVRNFHTNDQVIPAAERFYCVKRYAELLGNLAVAIPGCTQLDDLYFLIVGHNLSAPSERYGFDFPLTYQIKI